MYPEGAGDGVSALLPSHVVMFDDAALLEQIGPFLRSHRFAEEGRYFNAHFAVDRALQVRAFWQAHEERQHVAWKYALLSHTCLDK